MRHNPFRKNNNNNLRLSQIQINFEYNSNFTLDTHSVLKNISCHVKRNTLFPNVFMKQLGNTLSLTITIPRQRKTLL